MSVYEKTYQIHYRFTADDEAGAFTYTDDPRDIARLVDDDGMFVDGVWEGGSNIEYVESTSTQIGGELHTRYNNRKLSEQEWRYLARSRDAEERLYGLAQEVAAGTLLGGDIEQWHHERRADIKTRIHDLACDLVV